MLSETKENHAMELGTAAYTIGHSVRSMDEFIGLLKGHDVRVLVDVRTIPKSRRVPHFNGSELARTLLAHGIHYVHMKSLGGLRHPRKDSHNTQWRNESFRGYADYMETHEFHKALDELVSIIREQPAAIMCAEAVPWRCHRNMIADALTALHNVRVLHIVSPGQTRVHIPAAP